MDYQQFVVETKEKISLLLGPSVDLQIHTALKNNGNERTGISLSTKEVNASPTIYLEEFYEQFKLGLSLDAIAEKIVSIYKDVKLNDSVPINCIRNFPEICSKIAYRLVHAKKNEELLSTMPHIPYHDLAIVFFILFEVDNAGTATIPITNAFLDLWKTDTQSLYEIAQTNTPSLLPAAFKPMRVVIDELLSRPGDDNVLEDDVMFILTNPLRSFGAACILYPGILEQIACQLGENFYILPSSIHEVIIIAESRSPSMGELCHLVKETNQTQVNIEEVLSDTVYYYSFKEKELIECPTFIS